MCTMKYDQIQARLPRLQFLSLFQFIGLSTSTSLFLLLFFWTNWLNLYILRKALTFLSFVCFQYHHDLYVKSTQKWIREQTSSKNKWQYGNVCHVHGEKLFNSLIFECKHQGKWCAVLGGHLSGIAQSAHTHFTFNRHLLSEQDWESSGGKITGFHIKWSKCPHKGIGTDLFKWTCPGFLSKPMSCVLLRIIQAHLLLKTQVKTCIKEYKCRKTQPTYL